MDATGGAYVGGLTGASFPTTPGAFATTHTGSGGVGFVAKIASDGASLAWSTFTPGSSSVDALALDSQDRVCFTDGVAVGRVRRPRRSGSGGVHEVRGL